MTDEAELLQRYIDGDLPPREAEEFRLRLAEDAALQRELVELQTVGSVLRAWSARQEARAEGLLAPTLARVHDAAQRRSRHTSLGLGVAALLLFALPWAGDASAPLATGLLTRPLQLNGAAIERLEAGRTQARVFIVGSSGTPVVWLADDASELDAGGEQRDPG